MLLSINPEHVENIMNGKKIYEFRKIKCKADVDKIVIYSTAPVMQVVGEADVLDVIVDLPNEVWEITSAYAGISKDFFDSYFCNRDKAVAYRLGKVEKFTEPRPLSYYGVKSAPQSFVYI